MIRYTDSLHGLEPSHVDGIFDGWGWPNPPDSRTLLRVLEGSYRFWLAVDSESNQVLGFINAVSDGVLSAYIPLLKVRDTHQRRGIGRELADRMLASLDHLYMIDLICEPDVQPFYEKAGMMPVHGMALRHYENQGGAVT
jgi:ribosomal protein S18 acetylase RimI-like enzyme